MLQDPMDQNISVNALIALGSNMVSPKGGPRETLESALIELNGPAVEVIAASRLFKTPCFPAGAGPDFVNAAAAIRTTLPPVALLDYLHAAESRFDRERLERWGQRTLDIDLIAYGNQIAPDPDTLRHWIELPPERQKHEAPDRLILPHPRLQDRAFVLIPLAEIAPDWRHPLLGKTVQEMADVLSGPDKKAVRPLDIA